MGLVILALALAPAGSTSAGAPVLRSVTSDRGHVVATFGLTPNLAPGTIVVATSRSGLSHLLPSTGVKLRETMHASPDPTTHVARWRTRGVLPPGTYYVEVSAIQIVGVVDCMPRHGDCATHWSTARRVVVP